MAVSREASETDFRATSTGFPRCGGAANLLRAPTSYLLSSHPYIPYLVILLPVSSIFNILLPLSLLCTCSSQSGLSVANKAHLSCPSDVLLPNTVQPPRLKITSTTLLPQSLRLASSLLLQSLIHRAELCHTTLLTLSSTHFIWPVLTSSTLPITLNCQAQV